MSESSTPILPGKLGNPDMQLRDDPRADPRMVGAMEPFGLDVEPAPSGVSGASAVEALHEYIDTAEAGFEGLHDALAADLPTIDGVSRTVEVINGVDGNDITLFIHRPRAGTGPLPGILHLHGGGMTMLEAAGAGYQRWRDELAATGLVVVGVEFRNASGKHGPYPFPAGLNDCTAALQWTHDHAQSLGISKIVVSGESGGGNLTLATTLKAKQDGRLGQIAGVYAQCPYISNLWDAPAPELASLVENNGYFIDCSLLGVIARLYDPAREHARNPLAWPYHATTEDLRGLPPHVISVNQLDPLRDEGLAFARKLLDAGVSVVSRTVNGTCHAGDCIFRAAMADVYAATIRDIKGFADSL